MATRTLSAAGGNFGTAATWDEGIVPTAADDVVARADGTSGNLNLTTTTHACRSIDMTAGSVSGGTWSGNLTRTSNGALLVGHSTAGPGNVAMRFPATCTVDRGAGAITYVGTSGTPQTITMNGVTLAGSGSLLVNGDTLKVVGALTVVGSISLAGGTLDFDGQTISATSLAIANNTNTRVLALGSGAAITLTTTSASLNAQGDVTNFSTTGSGTITCSGAANEVRLRGADWSGTANGITLDITGSGACILSHGGTAGTAIGTIGNLQRHGTAVKTDELVIDGDVTVGGNIVFAGNSSINRLLVRTTTRGTQYTITCNGNVATGSANLDLRDIAGAGTASWDLSAITGLSGDSLGNSGITFTTSATQTYAGGGAGNVSDVSKWTSRVPLPQDDVVIASGTGALTNDMPRFGRDIDFTGFTQQFQVGTATIYGDLILGSSMSMSGTGTLTLAGRGAHTITSNGRTITCSLNIEAVSGSYALTDALITSRSAATAIFLISGTFDANDMSVTLTGSAGGFRMDGGTLHMGNGTWDFSGAGNATAWEVNGGTLNAEGSTISITSAGTGNKTFLGGGKTYNVVQYVGTNSAGVFTIRGSNTFAQLISINGARSIQNFAGETQTIAVGGLFRLRDGAAFQTQTAGTPATISAPASATIDVVGVSIKDSTASGGATFNAYNSTNVSGNTGWLFSKLAVIGLATETDSAFAVTASTAGGGGGQTVTIGLATETDTALAITTSQSGGGDPSVLVEFSLTDLQMYALRGEFGDFRISVDDYMALYYWPAHGGKRVNSALREYYSASPDQSTSDAAYAFWYDQALAYT